MEERYDGLHDLHGVTKQKEEEPEFIWESLIEMELALTEKVTEEGGGPMNQGLGYKKAMSMSPEYVENLKISFLRAENYNSKDAAARMIRFFDRKLELFGEEKLVKDITFQDLGEEEVKVLERGCYQVLPQRDRAGRAIVYMCGALSEEAENMVVVSTIPYF